MYIEGIANSISNFKEFQVKTNQTSETFGPNFIECVTKLAQSSQMVVQGGELSSAGLHERKMVKDWIKSCNEEEIESLDEIFAKISRIDEILKEKFSR